MSRNSICSLHFENYLKHPKPSRLKRFLLNGNPFENDPEEKTREKHCQNLYRLLQINRELSDLDSFPMNPLPIILQDSVINGTYSTSA